MHRRVNNMELVERYRTMSTGFTKDGSSDDEEGAGCVVKLDNPNIETMDEDILYHFALGTKSHNLKNMFEDVKFICVGGSPRRMETFASSMLSVLNIELPAGQALVDIAGATDRYALYKAGPVLAASHGIGMPSFSVMMHELFKILYHAESKDVVFFRIGTCGGLGLPPGTVVVTEKAVDALLQPHFDVAILGKVQKRPSVLDEELVQDLLDVSNPSDNYDVVKGVTMCTQDFYEGQARLDGAICDYTLEDKMNFLQELYDKGIRNIEMESLCFAAMCHKVGVKGAVACVTLLDRLKGDQITSSREQLKHFSNRPQEIVARLIKKRLGIED